MRTVSVGTMLEQIHGLLGTGDLTEWEQDFVRSVWGWSKEGKDTTLVTEAQLGVVERIYRKHFA